MRYDFAYAIDVFVQTVVDDYTEFSGRVGRRRFWHFTSIAGGVVALSLMPGLLFPVLDVISLVTVAGLAAPTAAIAARRMHDTGRSGWWAAAPGLNLFLACQPGAVGSNRFGADPDGGKLDAFA